jgi:hypothetical protein
VVVVVIEGEGGADPLLCGARQHDEVIKEVSREHLQSMVSRSLGAMSNTRKCGALTGLLASSAQDDDADDGDDDDSDDDEAGAKDMVEVRDP